MGTFSDGAAAATAIFTRYTASDTWTKGANTKGVHVEVIGAGGGGGGAEGGAAGSARNGGGGGGSGVAARRILPATVLGATETITIGAAGTAGSGGSSASGVGGGNGG